MIQKLLGVGKIYFEKDKVKYVVYRKEDIKNVIIPIFNTFPLQGIKQLDFNNFKLAFESNDKNYRLLLKKSMNKKRTNFDNLDINIKINSIYL